MNPRIARHEGPFPEPDFARLQAQVFAAVQRESPEVAAMLAAERARLEALELTPPPQTPMVRFGAWQGDTLVGWSCGWFERGGGYYMAHSGVVPAARRKGLYTALLDAVREHARAHGAPVLRSQHSVLNRAVLIAKLRQGFHISGLQTSAQMGTLVELTHHLSPEREALFVTRVIPGVAPPPEPRSA